MKALVAHWNAIKATTFITTRFIWFCWMASDSSISLSLSLSLCPDFNRISIRFLFGFWFLFLFHLSYTWTIRKFIRLYYSSIFDDTWMCNGRFISCQLGELSSGDAMLLFIALCVGNVVVNLRQFQIKLFYLAFFVHSLFIWKLLPLLVLPLLPQPRTTAQFVCSFYRMNSPWFCRYKIETNTNCGRQMKVAFGWWGENWAEK